MIFYWPAPAHLFSRDRSGRCDLAMHHGLLCAAAIGGVVHLAEPFIDGHLPRGVNVGNARAQGRHVVVKLVRAAVISPPPVPAAPLGLAVRAAVHAARHRAVRPPRWSRCGRFLRSAFFPIESVPPPWGYPESHRGGYGYPLPWGVRFELMAISSAVLFCGRMRMRE